jgi:predicted metal-dependent hydrolase
MPKPTLSWNRTLTARKFGHYQPSRDTVMISVTLDDPGVPDYVVDFVVYHELLHKKYGSMNVNGRRLSHSPAFRAEERRFADYHEAERVIHELALRQRGVDGLGIDDGDE